MVCKLCQINEANQTGSHILSSALISHCVNQIGKDGRDQEFMFGFSQSGEQDFFVGQNVLPEKIEEYNGEELTHEELEKNFNELIIDNYFCRSCEALFGEVESRFAQDLRKIRTDTLRAIENNLIIRLYFIIQAWRASSCRYNDWNMSESFEEYCRILILESCSDLKNNVEIRKIAEIKRVPLLLTYLETTDDNSSNVILITDHKAPYLLFLCDFVLQIYEVPSDNVKVPLLSFFNLNDTNTTGSINFDEDTFQIMSLDNNHRHALISSTISTILAAPFWQELVIKFVKWTKVFGKIPNKEKLEEFRVLLFDETVPEHKRFSEERIKELIKRIYS